MAYNNHYINQRKYTGVPHKQLHRILIGSLSILAAAFLIITVLFVSATFTAAATDHSAKLSPDLQIALQQSVQEESVRVIVHLHEAANLNALSLADEPVPRRQQVMAELQKTAVSAQATLLPQLQTLKQNGDINQFRSFWIINAIAVTGTPDAIEQLATHPSVKEIAIDHQRQYFAPPESAIVPDSLLDTTRLLDTTAVFTSPIRSWGIDHVRAPHVWHGLDIDGTGVTVAIMDSGVDWQHPDLLPNYRGNLGGGSYDHTANWYFAPDPAVTEPIDLLGHGTHVAGTAVGNNGIGVAPGAKWIAVGLTDENGFIYDSAIHAGFEWLLAPDGDPANAPDVINNSWGATSVQTTFFEDIEILQAAGIITVFSAGNQGPFESTIDAPGSYTNTLAVAATDKLDEVTWFSSRGPSTLTSGQTPFISAPGVSILSSIPDNQYGFLNGTSMATPHVSGALALMLSANPSLTREQLLSQLRNTAVSITPPHPNNDTGWGLLDTYAATMSYVNTGQLNGVVTFDGTPQVGTVISVTNEAGNTIPFVTNSSGRFNATLAVGKYTVHVQTFGFEPFSSNTLVVNDNQSTIQNVNLTQLPYSTISGIIRNSVTGSPVANVKVTATGTPVTAVTDTNGHYTLTLPPNQYKLTATKNGYKIGRSTILPTAGSNIQVDFSLDPTETILFVDAGEWAFESQQDIFQESLASLNYTFDTWAVRTPYEGAPEDLTTYDIVIWSDPYYSPGIISANSVITSFLKSGGDFLVTGQNIAAYDGNIYTSQTWWSDFVGGSFAGKTAVTHTISGASNSSFSDIYLSLNGGSSANNQSSPDISTTPKESLAEPIFYYDDANFAGLQAGRCQPWNAVYLGFGLEGVNDSQDRANIVRSAFDYFNSPSTVADVEWLSEEIDTLAVQGERFDYTLTLRNLSDNYTDTFTIQALHHDWPVTVITPTVTLGPCEIGQTAVSIQVPANEPKNSEHVTEITAVSGNNTSVNSSLYFQHKTPGNILLVDDDRWYDQQSLYQSQLDALGLTYDVWSTEYSSTNTDPTIRSELLATYDMIIWYTAYDWFAPITSSERDALTTFLEGGGRLFLTSQDFLYYNRNTPLVEEYFGVLDYMESITPTNLYGGDLPGLNPEFTGPHPLTYGPYKNFSDGIIPQLNSDIFYWSDSGLPIAIAKATNNHRAVLMSIPFETITETARTPIMNQIVGWLGDLGDSTFEVDQTTSLPGESRTYTITIKNDSRGNANQITMENQLPVYLEIEPNSISGGASYQAATRTLTWEGKLADNGVYQISYRASIAAGTPSGTQLVNKLSLYYAKHALSMEQFATVWVDTADFSTSTIQVEPDVEFAATAVTYTVQLQNTGSKPAISTTASFIAPEPLYLNVNSVSSTVGTTLANENQVLWDGNINPDETITITFRLSRTIGLLPLWYPTALILDDVETGTHLIEHNLQLLPYQRYFPFIAND